VPACEDRWGTDRARCSRLPRRLRPQRRLRSAFGPRSTSWFPLCSRCPPRRRHSRCPRSPRPRSSLRCPHSNRHDPRGSPRFLASFHHRRRRPGPPNPSYGKRSTQSSRRGRERPPTRAAVVRRGAKWSSWPKGTGRHESLVCLTSPFGVTCRARFRHRERYFTFGPDPLPGLSNGLGRHPDRRVCRRVGGWSGRPGAC
jgi:hypothetical protein